MRLYMSIVSQKIYLQGMALLSPQKYIIEPKNVGATHVRAVPTFYLESTFTIQLFTCHRFTYVESNGYNND